MQFELKVVVNIGDGVRVLKSGLTFANPLIVRTNRDKSEGRLEISFDQLASLSCLCNVSKCKLKGLVGNIPVMFWNSVVY